jgi:hypothetical protein
MTTPYRILPEVSKQEKPSQLWIHKLFGLHDWKPIYDMPELGSSIEIEQFLNTVTELRCSQCNKTQEVCWNKKEWEFQDNFTMKELVNPGTTIKYVDASDVAPRSLGEFLTLYGLVAKEYEYLRDIGWIKLVDKPD